MTKVTVERELFKELIECAENAIIDYPLLKACRAILAEQPQAGDLKDAYEGAREDLAIWKKRALAAEEKVRVYDQRIVDLGVLGMRTAVEKGSAAQSALDEREAFNTEYDAIGPRHTSTNREIALRMFRAGAAWQRAQSAPAGVVECSCSGQQRLIGGGCDACNLHDDIHQLAFETGEPDENASGYWFELEQFDEFVAELRVLLARQSGAVPPGYLLVSLDDLIEGDNYGVQGSDFQYCKLCQRESGAGMLNHGIPHEASCPLAAAPQPPAAQNSERAVVMPERFQILSPYYNNSYEEGWDACLDEFERLNATKQETP